MTAPMHPYHMACATVHAIAEAMEITHRHHGTVDDDQLTRLFAANRKAIEAYREGLSAPESADTPQPDPTPAGKPRRQRDAVSTALLDAVGALQARCLARPDCRDDRPTLDADAIVDYFASETFEDDIEEDAR